MQFPLSTRSIPQIPVAFGFPVSDLPLFGLFMASSSSLEFTWGCGQSPFICFSLRNHSPILPDVWCAETISSYTIFCSIDFLSLEGQSGRSYSPSWSKEALFLNGNMAATWSSFQTFVHTGLSSFDPEGCCGKVRGLFFASDWDLLVPTA